MTNKYLYFVANWKMYGDLKALNSLDKVIKFSKSVKQKKIKLIYCPPSTIINSLSKFEYSISIIASAIFCSKRGEYTAEVTLPTCLLSAMTSQNLVLGLIQGFGMSWRIINMLVKLPQPYTHHAWSKI